MNALVQSFFKMAVQRLEDHLLELPQAHIQTIHSFPPGKYERKIIIPAWTVLTGAEHKTAYRVRVEQGCIAVNTDDGVLTLNAPCEFEAKAGIKRVGRVFECTTVWVDIYENPDNCTDIATLEERLYVMPECGLGENRSIEADRKDYQLFLQQLDMSQGQMDAIVHADEVIQLSDSVVELRPSKIHGMGLFAKRDFSAGETICPGRIGGRRTIAGRYINHSLSPNADAIKFADDIHAVALRDIHCDEEILSDYRKQVHVNFGIKMQVA